MTISRQTAAQYLYSEFGELAAAAGQEAFNDSRSGWAPDLDNALRLLGEAEADLATATVAEGSRLSYFALAEYFAMRRLRRRVANRQNVQVSGGVGDFSRQLQTLDLLVDETARRAEAFGYDVRGGAWSLGRLNLDFIEPEPND